MRAVIFDLDGTLCDCSHRLHHVTGSCRDWNAFFAGIPDDGCYEDVANLVFELYINNAIVFCSGRPEDHRALTETWLERHGFGAIKALYMRPTDDHRPDHEVKQQLLRAMREDGYEPWLVVDDRPTVVAMWRNEGLTCLQVRDWDDRHDPDRVEPGLLTLMVGPSGAGKTSWLKEVGCIEYLGWGIYPEHIVSSDMIRRDLCGDFRDQSRNDEVFAALRAVVRERVRHGLPTVVDATNLRRKDRLACVEGTKGAVRYIVIDRPMEEKRRTTGWRAELPIDLLAKHDQTFRSQLKDILAGDNLPNVSVVDLRA